MKRILLAGLLLTLPVGAHAQSAALTSVNASCIIEGSDGDIRLGASAVVQKYAIWGDAQRVPLFWSDPAMARYCPNAIARYNAAEQRASDASEAEFQANLRHYGE